jgi:hypothetical protein
MKGVGQLADLPCQELVPASNQAQRPALLMPRGHPLEFMSWEDSQKPEEHGRMVDQGLILSLLSMV